jgi:hypothetical protein
MSSVAVARRIKVRLFVEGVEIPCISVQVQSQPNTPTMASIQIPPLAEGTRFLPRSIVHVFFLDLYDRESDANFRRTGDSKKEYGPTTKDKTETTDKVLSGQNSTLNSYKVLFVGELMGFQWTKSATSRSLVLQCADMSNYWDYAYQFNNTDIFGPGMKAMFSGGATNLFTDFLEEPGGAIVRIILSPPERYPKMQGLVGGIVHLLEAMGGSYYTGKKFAGQNIFFSLAELRLRLTQMITAYDKDPTAKKLLGGGYDFLFGRSIGNLGEQASFRKVINMLSGIIFHETYGQPCPRYVPSTLKTNTSTKKVSYGGGTTELLAGGGKQGIINSITRAKFAISDYASGQGGQSPQEAYSTLQLIKKNLSLFENELRNYGLTSDAASVAAARTDVQTAATYVVSPVGSTPALPKLDSAVFALQKVKGTATTQAGSRSVTTTSTSGFEARLNQQILRPDVWFSAPPRCNVIFPDQYHTLSYARQFMAEPTRLLLKTNDEFFGEDELFDNFYFAPKAITLKGGKNTLQSILKNDVMDHELFTGILPVFEKMGEFNIFAARSGQVDGKTPKVGLAQRSTNFLYFKYRFAARQLQVTGTFNPYVAAGFPGLVIDKYVDLDTFRRQNELLKSLPNPNNLPLPSLLPMLGTHFLCNFTEITHQLSQSEATTMLNCSYARQAEESVEFLGNIQDEIEIERTVPGKTALTTSRVASIYAPRVGMQGPGLGRIVEVKDVTSQEKGPDFSPKNGPTSVKELPVYGGPRDKKTKQLSLTAPVGWAKFARVYGKEVTDLVGDPELVVTFRAYEVTEEKPKTKLVTEYLPPEEYIRPGWYGDCWHPSKISEVYYDFFDTGAITETTQVENFIGSDKSKINPSSDADRTLADMNSGNESLKFARDQMIALSLTKGSNIQQSVAFLVLVYSAIRQAGFSTKDFIQAYTWRPIATMLDMFGSQDLQLDQSGKNVVRGVEGFHSRAFGPWENLFGLVTQDLESIIGIKKGSNQAQRGDTRKRKFEAVIAYAAQLRLSKGFLG